MHSITTSRIILHLRITGSKPASYMPKRIVFRRPDGSGFTEDSDLTADSMEKQNRERRSSRVARRDESSSFLVVDPYII